MNEEDGSRLEEFRQFRKEVRGSSEYLIVGIDVAKDKHYAFLGTARGRRFCGGWFLRIILRVSEAFGPRGRTERSKWVKAGSLWSGAYIQLS